MTNYPSNPSTKELSKSSFPYRAFREDEKGYYCATLREAADIPGVVRVVQRRTGKDITHKIPRISNRVGIL